jgi:hypothetical protein
MVVPKPDSCHVPPLPGNGQPKLRAPSLHLFHLQLPRLADLRLIQRRAVLLLVLAFFQNIWLCSGRHLFRVDLLIRFTVQIGKRHLQSMRMTGLLPLCWLWNLAH